MRGNVPVRLLRLHGPTIGYEIVGLFFDSALSIEYEEPQSSFRHEVEIIIVITGKTIFFRTVNVCFECVGFMWRRTLKCVFGR